MRIKYMQLVRGDVEEMTHTIPVYIENLKVEDVESLKFHINDIISEHSNQKLSLEDFENMGGGRFRSGWFGGFDGAFEDVQYSVEMKLVTEESVHTLEELEESQ